MKIGKTSIPNRIQGYREKVEIYFTTTEIEALLIMLN